ncbi:MAG: matrixin family metalloprotease [Actinobacteria bacterium]|nr:matrixin family metalloprotease [Actinomycetota bacterium]
MITTIRTIGGLDWDGSSTGYNLYAYTKCTNTTLTGNCDQYQARYDLADVLSFNTSQIRSLALHETGHRVGLDHSTLSDSFMRTGRNTIIHFSSHDKAHVDGRWG